MRKARDIKRRGLTALAGCVVAAAIFAPMAQANLEFTEAGVMITDQGGAYTREAGAHPDFTFNFEVPHVTGERDGEPGTFAVEAVRDVDLELPPGLIGNPAPFPECPMEQLVGVESGDTQICPVSSQIGIASARIKGPLAPGGLPSLVPLFNLEHGPDVPARFGFNIQGYVATITPRIRPTDYGISAGSFEISQGLPVFGATLYFWGRPTDPRHDALRPGPKCLETTLPGTGVCEGGLASNAPDAAFFTLPTACPDSAATFTARGDSLEHPGIFDVVPITTDEDGTPFVWRGCEVLPFEPTMVPLPGTHRAHSPTGLDVELEVPSNDGPEGVSASSVKKTVIDFPQGMSLSPSAVGGLEACSLDQIGIGTNDPPRCPDGSKLGNATIETQLLDDPLQGDVFLARQKENPFGATYAIYLAVKGPGFYLKLPGELNLDKQTGKLRAIFDDLPPLPFESAHLDFRGGPTAPLVTPDECGDYQIKTEVFPSARPNDPVVSSVPMPINEDCTSGGQFSPNLQAGVASPVAGANSPLTVRIRRADGEQSLSTIDVTLPKGQLASLRGLAPCPDAQAPTAACPASSQVGIATTAIGTGAFPLFVPQVGKEPTALYLGGPYKGAPYSLITRVPAQAGPFDFGVIVVRTAIELDPVTAQITAKSDPLPQLLEGVPLAYRDIRIEVQKPDFTVNPTSCAPQKVTSTLRSTTGSVARPSVPFKVGDCASLGFKPKLKLALKGSVKRRGHPSLKATLTARRGDANIARAQVKLPKSAFLDNAHIGGVCTRVQFAARKCPADSIYGKAEATTPLLNYPVAGAVYLRSNPAHKLPDLVADLRGAPSEPIAVELAGKTDSVKGALRNTFEAVPDVPVTKFSLTLFGGKKGLIEMSEGFCADPRAVFKFKGQNGKSFNSSPKVSGSCAKKTRK